MNDNGRLRVGYWLGDASLQSGGVGPYAWRTLRLLLSNPQENIKLIILCYAQAEARVRELLANYATVTTAELRVLPQLPSYIRTILQRGSSSALTSYGAPASSTGSHVPQTQTVLPLHRSMKALLINFLRSYRMNRWLGRLKLDLLHFPTQLPVQFDLHVSYLITMHDVQELHFPEYFTTEQRAFRALNHGAAIEGARKVIVSFEHIKTDLMKYFQVPEEKIQVCPLSVDNLALQPPSAETARVYNEKYATWKPYLLYPAQIWPHKNHLRLLDALSRVRQCSLPQLRLICTGRINDYYSIIKERAEALGLADAVLFTGIVPEDELSWLYKNTALVTIPTEYEAGSYPLLEALSERAPVICSSVTSLPETIGDPRFVFSPYDAEAMAHLIAQLVTNERLRADNLHNSAIQLSRLRECEPSNDFYNAYCTALTNPAP
jgi:glycosyltransferase involved in cell wall biosynthesis